MPAYYIAANCRNNVSYLFPMAKALKKQWIDFVAAKGVFNVNNLSAPRLCKNHFKPECFNNHTQYQMGFSKYLLLNHRAVPTIQAPSPESADTSAHTPSDIPITLDLAQEDSDETLSQDDSTLCQSTSGVTAREKRARRQYARRIIAETVEMVDVGTDTCYLLDVPSKPEMRDFEVQCGTTRSWKVEMKNIDMAAEEDEDQMSDSDDELYRPDEMDFDSSSSDSNSEVEDEDTPVDPYEQYSSHKEPHYIVSVLALLQLLVFCKFCLQMCSVTLRSCGTLLLCKRSCNSCHQEDLWRSSAMVPGTKLVQSDLLLSSSILFSGSTIVKALRKLQFMNVPCISERTFHHHQTNFLHKVIRQYYSAKQEDLLLEVAERNEVLTVGGDGRHDSMGKRAVYCTYSIQDISSRKILNTVRVHREETEMNSVAMEKEGLIRNRQYIEDRGLTIDTLTTDIHRSIHKYARELWTEVTHLYDSWHVATGLQKRIVKMGNRRGGECLLIWCKGIVSHMFACVRFNHDEELMKAMWFGMEYHCNNQHANFPWPQYTQCPHGPIEREWIPKSHQSADWLHGIIHNPFVIKDMLSCSRHSATSHLEAFHSLLNHYVPKMPFYKPLAMKSRTLLAVLDYNENCQRLQQLRKDGIEKWQGKTRKWELNSATLVPVLDAKTFEFVEDLKCDLFGMQFLNYAMEAPAPPLTAYQEFSGHEDLLIARISRYTRPSN